MAELKDILTDEQIAQLKDGGFSVHKDGEFIPMARFNEVNTRMKEAESKVAEMGGQIEELSKQKDKSELESALNELNERYTREKAETEARIAQIQKDALIDTELTKAGARDVRAVRATLDLSTVKVIDGKLDGFNDLVEASKKSQDFLWETKSAFSAGAEVGKQNTKEDVFAEYRKLK